MRHDDDALAGVPLRDPPDGLQNSIPVRFGRLALEGDGVALDRGESFPGAPVALAELGIEETGSPSRPPRISAVSFARDRSLA